MSFLEGLRKIAQFDETSSRHQCFVEQHLRPLFLRIGPNFQKINRKIYRWTAFLWFFTAMQAFAVPVLVLWTLDIPALIVLLTVACVSWYLILGMCLYEMVVTFYLWWKIHKLCYFYVFQDQGERQWSAYRHYYRCSLNLAPLVVGNLSYAKLGLYFALMVTAGIGHMVWMKICWAHFFYKWGWIHTQPRLSIYRWGARAYEKAYPEDRPRWEPEPPSPGGRPRWEPEPPSPGGRPRWEPEPPSPGGRPRWEPEPPSPGGRPRWEPEPPSPGGQPRWEPELGPVPGKLRRSVVGAFQRRKTASSSLPPGPRDLPPGPRDLPPAPRRFPHTEEKEARRYWRQMFKEAGEHFKKKT